MVCLGNICRSPLAEGVMQKKILEYFPNALVDSAGTGAWHINEPPDKRSIAVAAKYGIDISKQCARKITLEDFKVFDFIFTMDNEIHRDVLYLASLPEQKQKVHLLMQFSENKSSSIIPDPYYNGMAEFEAVYKMIDAACTIIAKQLHSNASKSIG